jgi:ABC-type transporter Mla maintaining outer membrane lipid asymmetry permease subunit MlaE
LHYYNALRGAAGKADLAMTQREENILQQQTGEIATLSGRIEAVENTVNVRVGAVERWLEGLAEKVDALRQESAKRAGCEEYRSSVWRPIYEALVKTVVPAIVSGVVVAGAFLIFLREFGAKVITK